MILVTQPEGLNVVMLATCTARRLVSVPTHTHGETLVANVAGHDLRCSALPERMRKHNVHLNLEGARRAARRSSRQEHRGAGYLRR
jgi:hypothetical protein